MAATDLVPNTWHNTHPYSISSLVLNNKMLNSPCFSIQPLEENVRCQNGSMGIYRRMFWSFDQMNAGPERLNNLVYRIKYWFDLF